MDIAKAVSSDLGRAPSSVELLELIAWGVKVLPDDAISDLIPASVISLRPRFKRGVQAAEPEDSEVRELNDASWVAAADFVAGLVGREGAAPTAEELFARLVDAFASSESSALSDVSPSDVVAVKPVLRKAKPRPKVGDLVAIPLPDGRFVPAVLVARNPFGEAFGIFTIPGPLRVPSEATLDAFWPQPIYTDDEQVVVRRWPLIGHDEGLLDRFPRVPELFQEPDGRGERGEHGLARSPEGGTRTLSAEEARDAGMRRKHYRESYMSEELEKWLPEWLEDSSR